MEHSRYLGIYLGRTWATVVLVTDDGTSKQLLNCFRVQAPEQTAENQAPISLGRLIQDECAQRQIAYDEAFIALDCSLFTQHQVHSDFTTHKQIAQTVRFDAEEAIATDATQVAIAFNIVKSDDAGSELSVFTVDRKLVGDMLSDLQLNNIDPVAIEPDTACLWRFLGSRVAGVQGCLFTVLGRNYGYFLASAESGKGWQSRTFTIGANANRLGLLRREIPMTMAAFSGSDHWNNIQLIDPDNSVNVSEASASSPREIRGCVLLSDPVEVSAVDGVCSQIELAAAYGAVLAHNDPAHVDFRQDFSPFQGRKVLFENTLKILSICVTVMMLTMGVYFQLRILKSNSYTAKQHARFSEDLKQVIGPFGSNIGDYGSRLKRELVSIKAVKQGQIGGDTGTTTMLTCLLEVFNNNGNLQGVTIDSVLIDTKAIILTGETSSRDMTLALFNAVDKHPHLRVSDSSYDLKAGKDQFRLNILPKNIRSASL